MAINTDNLETVLNSKIASATSSTPDKDLLLISKSVEALDNSIALKSADIGVTVQAYSADLATNASVATAVAGIVDSAPGTLDTLNELAAALGDDANFATTTATAIGNKADTGHTHAYLSTTPTLGGNLDGAGYSYTNLHPAVDIASVTSTHALDLTIPVHSLTMTGSTTFSTSGLAGGRMSVVGFSHVASSVPSFGAEVKWAGDTEPTWADHNLWLVSMTCFDGSVIGASATGFTV
jgi:hypothetical protein